MFGFLKNLLKRGQPVPEDSSSAVSQPPAVSARAPALPAKAVPGGLTQPNGGHPKNGNGAGHNGGHAHPSPQTVEVSLQAILDGMPLELQPRVVRRDVGPASIHIPLERVLSQLSQGAVRIAFGELRAFAPQVFTPEADQDKFLVPLPLSEILPRLNPALIKRRRVQRQVEVPAEISSPFDAGARSTSVTVAPLRTPEATPAMPVFPGRQSEPATQPPLPAASRWTTPVPAAPIALPKPTLPPPRAMTPVPMAPSTPAAPPPSIPMPRKQPETAVPPAPVISMSPPPAPRPAPKAVGEAAPLVVALTALAETWPDSIRKEVVQLNLVDAKIALPAEAVERGLRQGRLAFNWRTLRSWIKPAPLPSVSAQDATLLELPLKVIAPIFLNRQRENAKSKPKVTVDEDIPNLFFGFPQAETAAEGDGPATAKPSDTNYYVWDDAADSVREAEQEAKRLPSVGTRFISKYATPNEIVSRAAALDGVTGALIALPDGLLVASQLSGDLNADTLAAFLPQIFGKVSQCTKELRMGELNNLNFTVGNVPWKIFRVNAIFFAAFGRAGEPLPTAKLAALAAELDHKPK